MLIGYELKQPLSVVHQMDPEEVGWWIAFFKRKHELDEKAVRKRNNKRRLPID